MSGGRVLMIAHHFPPMGGSGANRALAFARYLPRCSWQPIVVTPGEPWAWPRDDALAAQIPADLRVIRTKSMEPRAQPAARQREFGATAQPRRSAVRSHIGHLKRFPDAHIGWLPFAVAAARRVQYDVAYSSSGPFTSHAVGLVLKRLERRPWVAELRDGWYRWNRAVFPDYPAWRAPIERRLEAAALRAADRVVLVTDRMADAFRSQYFDLPADHFVVVPNGFDSSQMTDIPSPAHDAEGFEVVHSGALYYGRGIADFLDAAHCLLQRNHGFAQAFKLTLVGTLDAAARAEVERHPLRARVNLRAQVDHRTALRHMASASVLLLVANTTPGAEATVPGKLFEYLAVGRPVLAVAPLPSSTDDVLRQTGGGWVAPAGDVEAIGNALQTAFAAHRNRTNLAPDPRELGRFDRSVLSRDLAGVFDAVT